MLTTHKSQAYWQEEGLSVRKCLRAEQGYRGPTVVIGDMPHTCASGVAVRLARE